MATSKVTFTLDELAMSRLQDASVRLSRPKSQIVREAIVEYHNRLGRLTEAERLHKLRMFDEFVPKIPTRPQAEVDRELAEIRLARKLGGRRTR
jgi:predicted DNA-binding protein